MSEIEIYKKQTYKVFKKDKKTITLQTKGEKKISYTYDVNSSLSFQLAKVGDDIEYSYYGILEEQETRPENSGYKTSIKLIQKEILTKFDILNI
tara:strand:- start:657 stop:938 length:282 start_codon:yes stop_codon:yes gene_type:complete